jgi:hypothetical protein
MLNFVENLLENERGPMNDQDLTKTDYGPDRGSLSFSNKFSTKFSIVSNKLYKQSQKIKCKFQPKSQILIFILTYLDSCNYLRNQREKHH